MRQQFQAAQSQSDEAPVGRATDAASAVGVNPFTDAPGSRREPFGPPPEPAVPVDPHAPQAGADLRRRGAGQLPHPDKETDGKQNHDDDGRAGDGRT